MKHVPFWLLLFALTSCRGDGSLTEQDVRRLVPEASSISYAELERCEGNFEPQHFDSHPLTLLLPNLKGEPSNEFRPLLGPERNQGNPVVLTPSGRATWLPAECLSDIEVRTEGDRASGSFRFRREGLFEGRVVFLAERQDGAWAITEFALPGLASKTTLLADGTWRTNLPGHWNSPEAWRSRELARIEARMPRDRDITLRVLDLNGQPVAGAHVDLHSRAIESKTEITASDGRAKFTGLPAGEMSFWVMRWNPLESRELVVQPMPVNAVPNGQEIDMPLRRGIAIQGIVTKASGQPVPGASVQIGRMREGRLGSADTDQEGRWQLFAIAGERHWIDAYRNDLGHVVVKDLVPGSDDIVLELEPWR